MESNVERRKSTIRLQLNQGFCAPDGSWSPTKTIAIIGQIVLLYNLNAHFAELIKSWETMMILAGFVIAPDLVKKMMALKYGGTTK